MYPWLFAGMQASPSIPEDPCPWVQDTTGAGAAVSLVVPMPAALPACGVYFMSRSVKS